MDKLLMAKETKDVDSSMLIKINNLGQKILQFKDIGSTYQLSQQDIGLIDQSRSLM
jgi:hypothetical protein